MKIALIMLAAGNSRRDVYKRQFMKRIRSFTSTQELPVLDRGLAQY